ncbi:unnamed protein product [Echinostoma caproni]|uniref:GRIP domain-containing protein n=1 Tax=Echinostoma caproni TaxID=27848 RepID=A0A183B1E4_9TREM|nr:unnamed protein product [Echinostoma caproni]
MDETNELSVLQERLKTEQERVLKLKAIVIREKKNGSNLSSEIEVLSTKLKKLEQENTSLREQLQNQHLSWEKNGDSTELEEKLRATESELEARVTQLQQKNHAFGQLSNELNQLMVQLAESKEREKNSQVLIKKLNLDLSVVSEQLSQFKENEQLFQDRVANEENLLAQLNSLKLEHSTLKKDYEKQLNDLERLETETRKRLTEQEAHNNELSTKLSEVHDQLDAPINSAITSHSSIHEPTPLIDGIQIYRTLPEDRSQLVNLSGLDLSLFDAYSLAKLCRNCLTHLQPLFATEDLNRLELKCLLDSCAEIISSYGSLNSTDRIFKTEGSGLITNDPNVYRVLSTVDEQTHFDLPSAQKFPTPLVENSSMYEPCAVDSLNVTDRSTSKEIGESDVPVDRTDDVIRLQMLEVKVNDLEKYAAEQVDRAKLQMIDWSQKLELQAADYDHLIRDKETEISDLRETCDRLSEEVSIYSNFCSSVMVLIGELDSSTDEKTVNWLSIAHALSPSENQVSGYELTGLLDALYHEVQIRVDSVSGTQATATTEFPDKHASNERVDSGYKLDEIKEHLNATVVALEEANKRASDAETTVTELQDELQKRDEKMNRMKQLLIRLKMDATEQQKTAANLEDVENAKQRLMDELEDRTRELEELANAKEQTDSALLLSQEEMCRLRVTLDNLKEERDSALRRFSHLQSEYNAYKVKALHTLRNSHTVDPTLSNLDPVNGSSTRSDDAVQNDLGSGNADLEQLNNQLINAQQRVEEASLRASLARTECDLAKEDLAEVRQRYSDLLKDFRDQREIWEAKLNSLTRERQHETTDRIKELEDKLVTCQTEYDEQLRNEQARQQRILQ